MRPYLEKNPSQTRRTGGVAQGIGPEFKPSTEKEKERKNLNMSLGMVVISALGG
jgi:hypothetical protein